ncbi:MAG: DNA polymerase Y family protein [Vulcanimicrobiaceae bacterium]
MILCVRALQPVSDWEAVLDALDAISPLIEDGGGEAAFCEMRGIAGTPARWLSQVRAVLAPFAKQFALGIGPNRFVASVAARLGHDCEPGGDAAAFVAPMPLDVLPIERAICERLHLLGIRTLGDLAALPHGPFVRRFGAESARWHAFARGIDDVPLVPRPRRARIERALFGEGSAASEEALLFALRTLVAHAVDDLVALGKRACEIILSLECENGDVHDVTVGVAHPTAREGMLFDLVRAHLEGVQLQAPVEGLRLRIERMEGGATPLGLFSADDPDGEALSLAVARMEAAFGDGSVLRARVVEGYRPERRAIYERFSQLDACERDPIAVSAKMQLRLFPEPQPLDVIIQNGVPHLAGTPPQGVRDFAGPWRVAEAWWSNSPLTRDDYDIMLDDGSLYRIAFRENRWLLLGVYD